MRIWQPVELLPGSCLRARIGPLTLYLQRQGDEWQMASRQDPSDVFSGDELPEPVDEVPAELSWSRWIVGDVSHLQLRPAMPDKPLVVRPEAPLKIPSGKSALFFVGIPISLRVEAGSESPINLVEVPTLTMSRIWFGDSLSGEFCYTLQTRARRTLDDGDIRPHRAVCPMWVQNESATQLDLQRLSLHVEHLTVYDSPKQLWTNGVQVRFRGDEQVAQVSFDEQPPTHEPAGQRLTEPRIVPGRSLFKRTFGGINKIFPWA